MVAPHLDSPQRTFPGWLPYLLLTIAPLCWAGNIVLARGVFEIIPPVGFAFWRWSIAFLMLLPFTWRHARQDWQTAIKGWKMLVFLSTVGISCFNTLLYKAVHTTTAINGSLIQTSMPAVIILISLIIYNERVTVLQIAGVILCIFGASLVVLHGRMDSLLSLSFAPGDMLMLLAVVLYALYSALLPKRPKIHPVSFLTYTFGIGALGLLPVYIWERIYYGPFTVTPEIAASILCVAVFPSIVAFFCWNRGIEIVGANRGGLFINLIPVFASIMAIFWLGETLQWFHIAGMMLICGGMILFNRK